MAWSDTFKFNPNSVNRYLPKIISYRLLAESSTCYFHVTTFIALSAGTAQSTSTLILVVTLPSCVHHCTTASFLLDILKLAFPLKLCIYIYYPIGLNAALPFIVFIHTCRIEDWWLFKFLVSLGVLITSCS